MAIILDADVMIRGEKGHFDIQGWLNSRPTDEFEIAAITLAELWHGIERANGSQRTKRRNYLETFLAPVPVLPYTNQTAFIHAKIWAELEASGKMIGFHDVIVAATAMEHGHEVATFNVKHFAQIKGLRVIEPK